MVNFAALKRNVTHCNRNRPRLVVRATAAILFCAACVVACRTTPAPQLRPNLPQAPAPKSALAQKLLSAVKVASKTSPQTVTLAWDQEPIASGFFLYQGIASRMYTNRVDVGNTNSAQMPAWDGVTNYYAATAYNGAGESAFSGEVSYTVPAPPPPTNLVIVSVTLQAQVNGGPWTSVASFSTNLAPTDPVALFRAVMGITHE